MKKKHSKPMHKPASKTGKPSSAARGKGYMNGGAVAGKDPRALRRV